MEESSGETELRIREIDRELPGMPREVRDVLHPVRLTADDPLRFRCHPGISCFNTCCRHIEILLTPYDLIRLRRRLNLSSEEFLANYADPVMMAKGKLPVAMMRMDAATGHCPFVTEAGCTVYSDRPATCRYYPLGLALMRQEESLSPDQFYFLIKESFCQGHLEEQTLTVQEWREQQGASEYDQANRSWMELIIKRRSAGDLVGTAMPLSEVFYQACMQPEVTREMIFGSSFLTRYQVDEETLATIRGDDLALVGFAMDWLKSVLFGDPFFPITESAKRRRGGEKTDGGGEKAD